MTRYPVLLALLGLAAACTEGVPPPIPKTGPVQVETLDATGQTRVETATAAAREFGERLVARMTDVVGEDGFAAAISVCKADAPRIAREVGQAKGVRMGRTSRSLRNPANEAPIWAETHLFTPSAETGPLVTPLSNGSLGVTFPIRTKKMCLACHGAPDAIAEEVRSRLAEDYPKDAATGFAEGDLRGLLWVEVK